MKPVVLLALGASVIIAVPASADPLQLQANHYQANHYNEPIPTQRAPGYIEPPAPIGRYVPPAPVPQETPAQEAWAQEIRAQEIRAQEIRAQEIRAQEIRAQEVRPQEPVRYAAASNSDVNLGGGFIEFLFNGGRNVAPPRPQHEVVARATPEQMVQPVRTEIDPQFYRQVVRYTGPEKPGTIVIDTPSRFLYLVQDNGTAMRYGIGVGKPGFTWAGVKLVSAKKEWPDWVPPPEMLQRRPDLPTWMAGGPDNPLGARALYLGSSLYRIHGSNEPWTIGQAVSSGCIRMRNEDVIDLYERVKVGTKVVVM